MLPDVHCFELCSIQGEQSMRGRIVAALAMALVLMGVLATAADASAGVSVSATAAGCCLVKRTSASASTAT